MSEATEQPFLGLPPDRVRAGHAYYLKADHGSHSIAHTSSNPDARPPPDLLRVWHDLSGGFRVDAAFLGVRSGNLQLHKPNGVVIEVPTQKMSAEDIAYVEKATSEHRTAATATEGGLTANWFDFFLDAECDVDDCVRYTLSFGQEKIEESNFLDITVA
ncbi:SLA1 homology domain 1, SHD1-domain-containing protein [Mycena rosella]|uniref:SLA1 homology domain 1, SHD1-domain-containing protein n=1 Tax=Mycena rosella TaxID=1033263 RepID=A0AAD7M812_MYCRO|nr:SLA1 homology domain 1, SHD1-domain-containing protein [Mycena rosella]